MRASAGPPSKLFQVFLELHRQCLAAGLPEVAYHALAAALHCAEADDNLDGVSLVASVAASRQEELDIHHPHHLLATSHAEARGTVPLFRSLAQTAHAIHSRLRAEQVRVASVARRRATGD